MTIAPDDLPWQRTLAARLSLVQVTTLLLGLAACCVFILPQLGEASGNAQRVDLAGKQRMRAYRALALAERARTSPGEDRSTSSLRATLEASAADLSDLREHLGHGNALSERVQLLEERWGVLGAELRAYAAGQRRVDPALLHQEVTDFVEATSDLNLELAGAQVAGLARTRGTTLVVIGLLAFAIGLKVVFAPQQVAKERAAARVEAEQLETTAIIDSTADGIVCISPDGLVLRFNATAERLFGYTREEVIGKNISLLMPPPYREEHDGYLARYLRTGERRVIGREREVEGLTKNGQRFPLALRVAEAESQGERMFIGLVQNIRMRREVETAVSKAVDHLVTTNEQIRATITMTVAGAQQQATGVAETVTTAIEVNQTAEQTAERARAVAASSRRAVEASKVGREAVEAAVGSMHQVDEQTRSVANTIVTLAERVQAVGEIVDTVTGIADQTNLLALNAAIEASRAGEHGKGFGVVAGEVRALAERSKQATDKVRRILSEIQQATNQAVLSMETGSRVVGETRDAIGQAGDTIQDLGDLINDAALLGAQIEASAAQQASGMTEVLQAMRNVDAVTTESLAASHQIQHAIEVLSGLAEELQQTLSHEHDQHA